jgi:DNA processing protein
MAISTPLLNTRTDTSYVFALAHLSHLGERTALNVFRSYPNVESWAEYDQSETLRRLKELGVRDTARLATTNWDDLLESAYGQIAHHETEGIRLVPYSSSDYPVPLSKIDDPPLILFVKGSVASLTNQPCIAVIGTRDTTMLGETVANRIAAFFSQKGFTIVSGLAKGIDTAAHLGAVDVHAPTIAVFATPLNKVYPAENKQLARRILEEGGAWISEIPLLKSTHRNAFVQRDRIQSGLSVAVIPVQTDVEGGTMHTVRFAEKQHRLLFCPTPIEGEQHLKQYAGVAALLHSGRAQAFQSRDYDRVLSAVNVHLNKLLDGSAQSENRQQRSSLSLQSPLFAEREKEGPVRDEQLNGAIERIAHQLMAANLAHTEESFDSAIRQIRQIVFHERA